MKKILFITVLITSTIIAQNKPADSYKIFGYLRTWNQTDFSTDQNKFLIKMARLGVKGKVNSFASYKLLMDFVRSESIESEYENINGTEVVSGISKNFSDMLLDAVATITPVKKLSFSLGQFKVPFSTDNLRGASSIDFVNRPLLKKLTPGLRDIGFMMSYSTTLGLPLAINAGLFNGTGQNDSEDDDTKNYSFRLVVDATDNLSFSGNYYGGKLSGSNVDIIDFGADYKIGNLSFSGEYGNRKTSAGTADVDANSYFVYGLYNYATGGDLINSVIPAVRYEYYDPNSSTGSDSYNRTTLGVAFQFAKITHAQVRLNYELYNYEDDRTSPDKLIIEFQVRF